MAKFKDEQEQAHTKVCGTFLGANLKAMVYKRINFDEQKQQYCARLTDEICEYV